MKTIFLNNSADAQAIRKNEAAMQSIEQECVGFMKANPKVRQQSGFEVTVAGKTLTGVFFRDDETFKVESIRGEGEAAPDAAAPVSAPAAKKAAKPVAKKAAAPAAKKSSKK